MNAVHPLARCAFRSRSVGYPLGALRLWFALLLYTLVIPASLAQERASLAKERASLAPVELLDRMTGHWVMTGVIARNATTHDVDVDWVLNREYIRIHEVARDKDVNGGPGYEAWIYLVWDAKNGEYAVMWLDNTAATNFAPDGVGHARPDGDRIPLVFTATDGSGIRTTFAYDRAKGGWSWAIDNVDGSGKESSFARLALIRKQ